MKYGDDQPRPAGLFLRVAGPECLEVEEAFLGASAAESFRELLKVLLPAPAAARAQRCGVGHFVEPEAVVEEVREHEQRSIVGERESGALVAADYRIFSSVAANSRVSPLAMSCTNTASLRMSEM